MSISTRGGFPSVAVDELSELRIEDLWYVNKEDVIWGAVPSLELQEEVLSFLEQVASSIGKLKIGVISSAPTFVAKLVLDRLPIREHVGHVFGCEYECDDPIQYWRSLRQHLTHTLAKIVIASSDRRHAEFALTSQQVELFIDLDPERVYRSIVKRNDAKCFAISDQHSADEISWACLRKVSFGY